MLKGARVPFCFEIKSELMACHCYTRQIFSEVKSGRVQFMTLVETITPLRDQGLDGKMIMNEYRIYRVFVCAGSI
jgi:hypothetical protein